MVPGKSQINQKIRAHRASAIGAANRNPRTKLPRPDCSTEFERASTGAEESFAITALSIMASDILLSAEKLHSAFFGCTRRIVAEFSSARGPILGKLSGRWHPAKSLERAGGAFAREAEDFAFLVCLLFVPKRRRSQPLSKAIAARTKHDGTPSGGVVLRIAAFTCLSLLAPRMALAQAEDVVTPVELFDPDSGDGARLSSAFILYPSAVLDLTYDSNVYNLDAPKTSDAFASLKPALSLRSDFPRHAVSIEASAELRRYLDISDENSEQYSIAGNTFLDLGYGIDVETTVGFARGIEQRGTVGDVFFTDEPVAFHDKRAGIEVSRTGGQLKVGLGATVLNRDYSDARVGGTRVDLSFRDVDVKTAFVRADLNLNDKSKLFTELGGNWIDYETPLIPSRDSSGESILVGISHEVTSLVEIEVGAGFIHQDFDDPAVESANEFNYRLAATWTPKPQWRLRASAARIVDASRAQESPAIISSSFSLGAERALGDRVLVGVEASYVEENFRGTPRKDERFTVSASTTYRLADRVGVVARVGYRDQDGDVFGRSYDGFSASIGLRAAW